MIIYYLQEWFRPSVICLTKCTFFRLCTYVPTIHIEGLFLSSCENGNKFHFVRDVTRVLISMFWRPFWKKRNHSVPESFIYLPDMYLKLRFALYPKPHWYSGKMTSVGQIIQDFQEWMTPVIYLLLLPLLTKTLHKQCEIYSWCVLLDKIRVFF